MPILLEEHGHQVLSAGSPGGAIALLKRTPHVDVLFTDIDLKDKIATGIELAQDAAVRWPHLKVIYTTGKDLNDGMRARFVENSTFLPKPYTVEELVTTLSVHFKISRSRAVNRRRRAKPDAVATSSTSAMGHKRT